MKPAYLTVVLMARLLTPCQPSPDGGKDGFAATFDGCKKTAIDSFARKLRR